MAATMADEIEAGLTEEEKGRPWPPQLGACVVPGSASRGPNSGQPPNIMRFPENGRRGSCPITFYYMHVKSIRVRFWTPLGVAVPAVTSNRVSNANCAR
jgi:hypothetical protein